MAQEMAEDRPQGGRSTGQSDAGGPTAGRADAGESSDVDAGTPAGGPGGPEGEVRPETEQVRRRRLRHRLTQALAVAVIVAVFAFIFPRIASYGAAWRDVSSMTAPWILTLVGVTVVNLVVNWWFITTCLPGLSLPRAAAMNLSSTAVANTVPAGGAIALGVSWNMASAWGFSGEQFTLYTLVSGLWSQFAKFGTPAVALIALSAVGSANHSLVLATVLGTAVFLTALGAVIAALHSDGFMAALGRLAQRFMDWLTGLFHRTGPQHVERGFLDFKHRAAHLLASRGWLISISTLASDLAGWLVQLACLRALGVSAAEVSWEKSFAGYALIRLLTTIPITPGGLGITEVGLTEYLGSGENSAVTDRIAAAILLARALTFVVPIPLGAVNFTVWKWLRRKDDPLG
ncbi:flippase-like domain-containing protein [Actinospica durhamensis]|uniref:Flippase-like domain-containing protein n=1 Tax=Actinospica durhamensis TaxID=1508375 RepID=A0A941F0T6_9ACTN|nr:lysylphosphatidylglycerol synthase domain-containing protein [Actinospica durhamensis]MBR7838459.1 flippase-like domain-containing protein [Actinospica durhamensis]